MFYLAVFVFVSRCPWPYLALFGRHTPVFGRICICFWVIICYLSVTLRQRASGNCIPRAADEASADPGDDAAAESEAAAAGNAR